MRLNLDAIECRSAFDGAPETAVREIAGPGVAGGAAIRVVEVEDMLYLPSVLEPRQSLCLIGERSVPREAILEDYVVDFLKEARSSQPAGKRAYDDTFDPNVVRARVCVLGNVFSRNFGHWTEELLKVALLERAGDDCSYVISTLPRFAEESLWLLGVDASRISGSSVRRGSSAPSLPRRSATTTSLSIRLRWTSFEIWSRGGWPQARADMDRVSGWRGTRMLRDEGVVLNRDEVYRCIKKHGFEVVDMATLSLSEQLRRPRDAGVIAGAHGSQFVHAQFMAPGSAVIECFSPIHVNPSILQVSRVLGHSYHQIVARSHLLWPYQHGLLRRRLRPPRIGARFAVASLVSTTSCRCGSTTPSVSAKSVAVERAPSSGSGPSRCVANRSR